MKRIAILSSTNCNNFENLLKYIETQQNYKVVTVISNTFLAGVLKKAKINTIHDVSINFPESNKYYEYSMLKILESDNIDLIISIDFYGLIPDSVKEKYKIILSKQFLEKLEYHNPDLISKTNGTMLLDLSENRIINWNILPKNEKDTVKSIQESLDHFEMLNFYNYTLP